LLDLTLRGVFNESFLQLIAVVFIFPSIAMVVVYIVIHGTEYVLSRRRLSSMDW